MTARKGNLIVAITLIIFAAVLGYTAPHKNEPPIFGSGYPMCHWDGSGEQTPNDWEVFFDVREFNEQTRSWESVWKQQVAKGLSQKAAERLCDAYVETKETEK